MNAPVTPAIPSRLAPVTPQATPIVSPSASILQGFNVLLMGPSGTGKTHAIGTLVDAGVEVFYLGLENGLESLVGYYRDRNLPIPDNLHWHQLEAQKASFSDLLDSAKKVNTMSLDSLAKIVDPNKARYDSFVKVLEALNNFKDDRTGESFGSVTEWGPSRCLVMDSLSSLCRYAMTLVIGGKAVSNQSDWGIAQGQIEKLLHMITEGCACHFVLISHIDREVDAVMGGVKLMVSALGKALAPKLPPLFSDVILTVRSGDKYSWDTGSAQADVKTRNLPIASNLPPDFGTIVKKWQNRGGVL